MSLLDALRSGVKIANNVTRPLQPVVMYQRASPDPTGYGNVVLAAAVPLHAIVDFKAVQVRTRGGITTVTRATIELLDITEVVNATGGLGIGNDDQVTFPDGD